MDVAQNIQRLEKLIAQAKLEEALESLFEIKESFDQVVYKEIVLHTNNYHRLSSENRTNQWKPSEYNIEISKLTSHVLELILKLKKETRISTKDSQSETEFNKVIEDTLPKIGDEGARDIGELDSSEEIVGGGNVQQNISAPPKQDKENYEEEPDPVLEVFSVLSGKYSSGYIIGYGRSRDILEANPVDEQEQEKEQFVIALPVLKEESTTWDKYQKKFQQLQLSLEFSGCVKILEISDKEDPSFIVYEKAKGQSIHQILTDRKGEMLPVETGFDWLESIGDILSEAHERNLVHGELNLKDIWIENTEDKEDPLQGIFQILDLGYLQTLVELNALDDLLKAEKEKYRAPEQVEGGRIMAASDIWSLGIIAFELFTNEHPFEETFDKVPADHMRREYPKDPNSFREDLPIGLKEVLWRAMSEDPNQRFATIEEMMGALRRVREENPTIGGFNPDLELALEAGQRLAAVVTDDEYESLLFLEKIAKRLERPLYSWRITRGVSEGVFLEPKTKNISHTVDPDEALIWLDSQEGNPILIFLDVHIFFDQSTILQTEWESWRQTMGGHSMAPQPDHGYGDEIGPATEETYDSVFIDQINLPGNFRPSYQKARFLRRLLDLNELFHDPSSERPQATVILLSQTIEIPDELIRHIDIFGNDYPHPIEVRILLHEGRNEVSPLTYEEESEFVWNAKGLTHGQIRDVLRMSQIKNDGITPQLIDDIKEFKENIIRRQGFLELLHPTERFLAPGELALLDHEALQEHEYVVGLDNLRNWIRQFATDGLDQAFVSGLLPMPKSLLLGGLPGCGKSMCAKAMAGTLGLPLVKLDIGRIFGGHLGDTEANLEQALMTADSLSPVVLWIDEIEKSFGHRNGEEASGTSARVFHQFLVWLQERIPFVFLIATANEGSVIPMELRRAGRFDIVFFLDLPDEQEREQMISYYLNRNGVDLSVLDISTLSELTVGYSGAEIRSRIESLFFRLPQMLKNDPEEKPFSQENLKQLFKAHPEPIGLREDFSSLRFDWLNIGRHASQSEKELIP